MLVHPTFLLMCMITPAVAPAVVGAQDWRAALQQRRDAAEGRLRGGDRSAPVWCELLDALYPLDESARALGAARDAVREHPADRGVMARTARAYFRGGRLEDAARLLSESADITTEPAAAVVLSKLLHSEGRLDDALTAAAMCLRTHPDDPELHYQLALLHGRLQQHDQAVVHYERAGELASRSAGYPLELIARRCAGRAELHRRLGTAKMNQVTATGAAPLQIPAALPLPTLEVRVNGEHAARMLFDPAGGAALSIDDDLARRAGLQPVAPARVADLTGGLTPMDWALTPAIQIGPCRVEQVVTQIYDFSGENLPGIDGIVGAALFAGHRLELDLAGSQLRVAASQTEDTNPQDPQRLVMEVRFVSGDQAIIPVMVKDQRVNGALDIGSPATCLSTELLAGLVPAAEIRSVQMGGLDATVAGGLPYAIGRRTFVPPQTVALSFIGREASSTLGTQIGVLLGWDIFRQMRTFTIDYPANRIIIEWVAASGGP